MCTQAVNLVSILFLLTKESLAACQEGTHSSGCIKCDSSHYLQNSFCKPCDYPCASCDGYRCTSCKASWFGKTCNRGCSGNCKECHIDNGSCISCKLGYYGSNCDKKCNRCEFGLCDFNSCTFRCKVGFYEERMSGSQDCYPCSEHCKYCVNYQKCTVCNDGYYLQENPPGSFFCFSCLSRPSYCQTNCSLQNCRICRVHGPSKVCTGCNNNYMYTGGKCVLNTIKCLKTCSTKCNQFGMCLGHCKDGWAGDMCTKKCPAKCFKCHKNESSICQNCTDHNFYTSTCDVECPSSCRRVAGASTCRIYDGYCINGCDENSWGKFCNESCSVGCALRRQNSNVCNRIDGRCMNGCKEGFVGYNCNGTVVTVSVSNEDSVQTSKEETSTGTTFFKTDTTQAHIEENPDTSRLDNRMTLVLIGSLAGGGLAVITATFTFITCLVNRRRKINRTENASSGEEAEIIVAEANLTSQTAVPGNDDCLYAQVNKMNKRYIFGKEEPQTAKTKNAYDFEVALEKVSNVDDSDLEEIKEENLLSIESEVNIPTSDTYYNTASLVRSRTEVPILSEYITNKTDYKKEFERLPVGLTRACTEAFRPNNRIKNRYKGIYAYDATRVVLKSGNYVNANLIYGDKQYPAYIASLGPTKSTMSNFATFWEMIWQEKTDKIVMLTNLDEAKKMKCEQYWPMQGNENNYGEYKVKCMTEKVFSECIMREFIVARGNYTHEVTQYQYTAWPDKTVPDSVASLLEFRDIVEQKQSTTTCPVMVHCSAGIGRTGTYIALDILIKEGKDDNSVDIFGCVNALRGQRVQLVQNLEQYVYLHHCVLYALGCAPEPLPVSTMAHFTSDERLSTQHKAFVSLQHLTNRDKKMGTKNVTRKENRTGADIPDDKHRVRLGLIEKDYINAVYVNGYQEYNKFILAQTPLQGTLEDFASMLYQEQCSCVVCLDDENVIDKSIVQYLPSVNKVVTFGQFQLICTDIDRKQDFICRKLKVSRIGVSLSEEVSVFHYQFKGWSSIDCVPRSVQSFLNLVTDVEKIYQSPNSKHPVVVHCSTGAERSALFCAVSILLEKVALEKEEHLRFCYSCVEQMSEVSDSSTYYNSRNM